MYTPPKKIKRRSTSNQRLPGELEQCDNGRRYAPKLPAFSFFLLSLKAFARRPPRG
jgi:hypothetical protein